MDRYSIKNKSLSFSVSFKNLIFRLVVFFLKEKKQPPYTKIECQKQTDRHETEIL